MSKFILVNTTKSKSILVAIDNISMVCKAEDGSTIISFKHDEMYKAISTNDSIEDIIELLEKGVND